MSLEEEFRYKQRRPFRGVHPL